MDLLEFTRKLLEYNTTNPPGDQIECVKFIQSFFSAHGVDSEIRTVQGAPSLISTINFGPGGENLCWIGHWDVVPSGPVQAWSISQPFEPKITDGALYGRGACDMKSGVAAAVFATLDLIQNPPECGTLVLAILGDEENGGLRGGKVILPELHDTFGFKYGIVGEPSNFKLKIARRGVSWGKLTFHGVQAHAARPDEGDNPIIKLGRGAVALNEISFSQCKETISGKPTLSMTTAHSGEKDNIIPGAAQLGFDIRTSPGQTPVSVRHDIIRALDAAGLILETDYHLDLDWIGEPYQTTDAEFIQLCQRVIAEVSGETPELSGTGGASDGRFLAYLGVPVVEFGLESTTLHKVNENCKIDNLIKLRKIYTELFRRLINTV